MVTLDLYYSFEHQYTMTINKVQHSTVILDFFNYMFVTNICKRVYCVACNIKIHWDNGLCYL